MTKILTAAALVTMLASTAPAFADPANAPGLADRGGVSQGQGDPQGAAHNEHAADGSQASIRG